MGEWQYNNKQGGGTQITLMGKTTKTKQIQSTANSGGRTVGDPLDYQLLGDRTGHYSKHVFLGEARLASKVQSGDGAFVPNSEATRTYYYHSDHLGSAQLITDCKGEEYERLEYTPYGELWIDKTPAFAASGKSDYNLPNNSCVTHVRNAMNGSSMNKSRDITPQGYTYDILLRNTGRYLGSATR